MGAAATLRLHVFCARQGPFFTVSSRSNLHVWRLAALRVGGPSGPGLGVALACTHIYPW